MFSVHVHNILIYLFIGSECDLRAHISTKHCGYLPLQCYLCLKSLPPRTSFEPTEEKMKKHFLNFHKSKELEYISKIEKSKRDQVEDIMRRSLEGDQTVR